MNRVCNFKHKHYNGWKLMNYWNYPVLNGSKCFYTDNYDFPVKSIVDNIREYLISQFGKRVIVDYAFSPVESYKRLKGYKPKSLMLTLDVVFKVDTTKSKEMFKKYQYVFDNLDKFIEEYE